MTGQAVQAHRTAAHLAALLPACRIFFPSCSCLSFSLLYIYIIYIYSINRPNFLQDIDHAFSIFSF
jgi:hypothetical protein